MLRRVAIVCVALCFALPQVAFAQRIKQVHADVSYTFPKNVSLAAAEQTALDRARLQAIADEFGTTMSQANLTTIKQSTESSSVDMLSLNSTNVKGVWLEDSKPPIIGDPIYSDGQFTLRVQVWGRAREIVSTEVKLISKVLVNGTADRFESDRAHNGDEFFVKFRTPTRGWVAVYLECPLENMVYCLLPYRNDPVGKVEVSRDRDYLFFSPDYASESMSPSVIDSYVFTTERESEVNMLHVIFSENEFSKPTDYNSGGDAVSELTSEDFQRWLADSRSRDTKMMCVTKEITIKK